jgi:hypothetical protein
MTVETLEEATELHLIYESPIWVLSEVPQSGLLQPVAGDLDGLNLAAVTPSPTIKPA